MSLSSKPRFFSRNFLAQPWTWFVARHVSDGGTQQWLKRHLKDEFVKKSRYQNFRSRAAYKLIEIDDRYKLLQPGMIVIECGAAPGSWTQVLVERLRLKPPEPHRTGAVIALDKSKFTPVDGAICLPQLDFTSQLSQSRILNALDGRKADLILSDMSPNVTGQHDLDHERILKLIYATIQFASICLKENGNLLMKLFNGSQTDKLIQDLNNSYASVKRIKPQASRNDSTELYILAKDFQGHQNSH